MPEVRAVAKNIGASPKRIRPIANLVRGKKVEDAIQQLKFLTSPWANVISKVIKSAASNAENNLMMKTMVEDQCSGFDKHSRRRSDDERFSDVTE